MIKYICVGLGLLICNIYQWYYAYTEEAGFWVNQNIEAVFEWTVVSMVVFLPYFYTSTIPLISVSFEISREDK